MFRTVSKVFDFQIDNADEIENHLFIDQRHNCIVYRLPTGGGKTLVAGETIQRAIQQHGHNALFITHRDSILKQTYALFNGSGIDTGKVVAGGSWNKYKKLNIAMDKSFTARMKGYEDCLPKFLVIDEAHHVKGGNKPTGMGRIADAVIANGGKVLKLTATPVRLDGSGLGLGYGGFATHMVNGPCARDLIKMGRIMQPRLLGVPLDQIPDMSGAKKTGGDFSVASIDAALQKAFTYGHAVEHYQAAINEHGKSPSVVFCRSEDSAQASAEAFRNAGYRVEVLTQKSANKQSIRDSILKKLETGQTDLMISVDIVSEGFDMPSIGLGIMERPTESITVFMQQLGRLLRYAEGKSTPALLDMVGNCWRHRAVLMQEFFGDGYPWSLKGIQKSSSTSAASESEPALTIKRCLNPDCNIVSPGTASKCECGWGFPVQRRGGPKFIDGKLQELDFSAVVMSDREKLRQRAAEVLRKKPDKSLADYHKLCRLEFSGSGKTPKEIASIAYRRFQKHG